MSELKNKRLLITGGTGSFGSRFIKMLLEETDVQAIRSFSRDEHKNQALLDKFGKSDRFDVRVGDLRDKERIKKALYNIDWVVHAAALKQVPMGELEPFEFIKTNIEGTRNLIEAVNESNRIEKLLLVSTDKAVNPINLYGCTKMVAEKMMLMAHLQARKNIKFSCTRYGNVIGARSTVVPLYLSLKDNEPTPVTDPMATRFWITLKQANEFILEVLLNMQGNDIWVPKMPAANIIKVAEAIRPGKPIKFIGHRKGDKLHEELLSIHESFDFIKLDSMEAMRIHEKGQYLGRSYSSLNAKQLSVEEIRELMGNIPKLDNPYAPNSK